ncbi:hypothetical protein ABW20_dc0108436 [Dactylellina cionopaga]|nr:hypothetical protein ABW20_dc0108436 [Dactylellina cionopaga]
MKFFKEANYSDLKNCIAGYYTGLTDLVAAVNPGQATGQPEMGHRHIRLRISTLLTSRPGPNQKTSKTWIPQVCNDAYIRCRAAKQRQAGSYQSGRSSIQARTGGMADMRN